MRFSLETFEGAPARDQGPRPSLPCRFSVSLIFHVSETLKKALACFKVLHVTISCVHRDCNTHVPLCDRVNIVEVQHAFLILVAIGGPLELFACFPCPVLLQAALLHL